ncbi:MAG TPA: hypothetical protein VGT08_13305 [Terracidiphilus sp.]|nr:hypothetical protein [Terracidiphilus sp.]
MDQSAKNLRILKNRMLQAEDAVQYLKSRNLAKSSVEVLVTTDKLSNLYGLETSTSIHSTVSAGDQD